MNAELDATVGPILKTYADRAGVVITNADGDQPGVIMNLVRYVEGHRLPAGHGRQHQGPAGRAAHPRNLAGLRGTARPERAHGDLLRRRHQGLEEMAIVANGTGLRCGTRGMYGPECGHVREAVNLFPKDQLMDGGLVDYVLGAEPSPGVFVLGYHEDPV